MSIKLLCYDCETTHLLPHKGSIHQLAGMVIIDNEIIESFDFRIRPHERSEIDPTALKAGNVTLEQVQGYPHRTVQFNAFKEILQKYIDPYDSSDKFTLLGFKNEAFDNFLINFFTLEGDDYFGAWFWYSTIDVSCLAAQYLLPVRHTMQSFKLSRIAKVLGLAVDEDKLHSPLYDCELTFQIYNIVKGKTINDWEI